MKKCVVRTSTICGPTSTRALTCRVTLLVLLSVTAFLLSQCGGMLSGVGGGPKPNAILSAQSLSFNSQTKPFGSVTLTNSGNASLNVTGITISPPFSERDACIPTVAPGASCDIGVSFTPSTATSFSGTLSISDNAPGQQQTVSLSGVGATGNTTLTGNCLGSLQAPPGPPQCSTLRSASTPSLCPVGNAALTPVDVGDPTCGASGLADLSTHCQFTDVNGNQFKGSCEAQ